MHKFLLYTTERHQIDWLISFLVVYKIDEIICFFLLFFNPKFKTERKK